MKKLKDAHKLVREDVQILGLIILNVVYKFDSPEQCWAKQSNKFATFSLPGNCSCFFGLKTKKKRSEHSGYLMTESKSQEK